MRMWVSTIRDVAKRAGVAISTVSAVINRSAPTSDDVVARVERAIAEIGYAPQRAAQTLRTGRSKLVGVVVPDITNPHFSALARVVETECLKAGYMTFVYNTDEDTEHEMRILRMMRGSARRWSHSYLDTLGHPTRSPIDGRDQCADRLDG